MIKAKELRIGNYIQDYECEPYIFQVEELRKYVGYEIWAFYRKGSAKAKEVDPIPLTEEWLLKFGGKPLSNGYWISVSNLKAELHFEVFKNTDEIVTTIKSSFCDLILDRIKYVHQLQNLYFALTNTELIIK